MEAQLIKKISFLHTQKKDEKRMDTDKRIKNGIFFTNDVAIIDKMIGVIDFSTIETKKILEPSCGQGIIILRILDKFYQQNQSKNSMDKFIANNLIFNDLDIEMAEKIKENIQKMYFNWFNTTYKGVFQGFVSGFTLRNNSNNNTLFEQKTQLFWSNFMGR